MRARLLLVLALLVDPSPAGAVASAGPSEQEVKAAFVYQFTRFVEWPPSKGPSPSEFVVAVMDAEQFGAVAERALQGKSARDLPVTVRRISTLGEAPTARILFVGSGDAPRLAQILESVEGSGILTVGDSLDFAERGGMIGFRIVDNRVRFDINVEEASRSGLKISSEVLKLARVVRTRGAP